MDKELIKQKYLEGLSVNDIASQTTCTIGSVSSTILVMVRNGEL